MGREFQLYTENKSLLFMSTMSQESNIGDSYRKRLQEVQGQFGFRSMYVPREERYYQTFWLIQSVDA